MKLRVLLPLLVFGLIAVIAVLIPIAQSIADSRTQQLALQRTAALDQVVQRARTALVQGDAEGLPRLARVARQLAAADFAAVYLALALDAERAR